MTKKNKKNIPKEIKKKNSDWYYVVGAGILLICFFCWTWFAGRKEIKESELVTISGLLDSELIRESTGGSSKTYYWTLRLKEHPVIFTIGAHGYSIFNSSLFKEQETANSYITVKVNKDSYDHAKKSFISDDKLNEVGIKSLKTTKRNYFNLEELNAERKSDHKYSYIFLIVGLVFSGLGLRMKK